MPGARRAGARETIPFRPARTPEGRVRKAPGHSPGARKRIEVIDSCGSLPGGEPPIHALPLRAHGGACAAAQRDSPAANSGSGMREDRGRPEGE